MRLKMAPNSGFAVLLRSPWWISFMLAAAIVAGCYALLPSDIAPFAAVGALPLSIIGCIAAWRQWRRPSAARVQQTLEQAAAQPWSALAQQLQRAWQSEGHQVEPLAGSSAADLRITEASGRTLLVAARRCKAASHGVQPLRALQQEIERRQADGGVYLVLQGQVSEQAHDYARAQGLALLEGDALATLLRKATG